MTTSLRQRAYDHIQGRVLAGALPPGSQVSELSLAREIGISRTPVREAIRRLVHEGVLEQVPRYGTIVRSPRRQDIVELYEVREALETFAVAQAAERITAADLESLGRLCEEIGALAVQLRRTRRPALTAAELQRFLAADLGFHLLLLQAAGNRRILKIVADSQVLTRIFGTPRQEHTLAIVREAHHYHQAVLRALRRRDGGTARQRLAEHIQASKQEALNAFDRSQTQPAHLDLRAEVNRLVRGQ